MVEKTAMEHLGNILYMLGDLHDDDRSDAFDAALEFYNRNNPDAQIQPIEGYVTRIVHETPLTQIIAKYLK